MNFWNLLTNLFHFLLSLLARCCVQFLKFLLVQKIIGPILFLVPLEYLIGMCQVFDLTRLARLVLVANSSPGSSQLTYELNFRRLVWLELEWLDESKFYIDLNIDSKNKCHILGKSPFLNHFPPKNVFATSF